MKVKALILRAAGTNCDRETAFAFERQGASAELVHVNELVRGERHLKEYQILAIPGGFTYGDDVASGKILANELRYKLNDDIQRSIDDGKLIIGICNGFQVLVKAGILPGIKEDSAQEGGGRLQATLTLNDSAKYEDRWVYLANEKNKCVWTKGIDDIIYLPVAHGEGKFVARDRTILNKLRESGQIVLRYVDERGRAPGYPKNPNGSQDDIAGICDATGRIFGLMPHPERHITATQHPRWTRGALKREGDGAAVFRNGVTYAKRNL